MALEVGGKTFKTDEEGFLLDPHIGDESLAQHIAQGEKLDLNEASWAVVRYVREHLDSHGQVPEARHVLKELGKHFGRKKAARKFLYELFPYGYEQQACKIAAMRKPRKLMLDV
jgi:tRNA 2-thiouridine synthesizing protein E